METRLAIASRRDERRYAARPVPEDVVNRVLDAGRVAGSAMNRQPWRFYVVEDPALRERIAASVYAPDNVRRAPLVVLVSVTGQGPTSFDAGRATQNMLLAAWDEGLLSCPNGLADADAAAAAVGLGDDERPAIVLTFGWPERAADPARRTPEEWSARANRKPPEEIVVILKRAPQAMP